MKIKNKKQFESLPSGTRMMFQQGVCMLMVAVSGENVIFRALLTGKECMTMSLLEDGFRLVKFIEGFKFTSELYPYDFFVINDQN